MGISIREAAEKLGISQTTIRRRLRSGWLTGHKETGPQGEAWVVELEGADQMDFRSRRYGPQDPTAEENLDTPEVEEDDEDDDREEQPEVPCVICKDLITRENPGMEAAYGSVHQEPCSHQVQVL